MASSVSDYASVGRAVDQVYQDFCGIEPGRQSSDMLRDMVGATFAGIQAIPDSNQYRFDYLVKSGFAFRPWVHTKVCHLSRNARWDVTGVDHRSASDIHLFDIFERLGNGGPGGKLRAYFDHIGVRHALMSSCLSDRGWQYVMFAGRSPGQDGFDESDRARLRAIVPHFRRALRARKRLIVAQGIAETCAAGMDSLGVGVVLIDGRGQTSFMNGVADRMIGARDAFVDQPRFGAMAAGPNRRLQALLRAASRDDWSRGSVAISIPRNSGVGNYELVVEAQPCPIGMTRQGEVVIYIRDRMVEAGAAIELDLLQDFFGLTAAEALVARAAVSGRSTHEIASHLGIQYNTVRAHFRSIYAKCGWSNRSDLVQMVLGSPAGLGGRRSGGVARAARLS